MAKSITFDEDITVEEPTGNERDINVTIYYTSESPDPSVGYNGSMEEFGFESSEDPICDVKWLEARLTSDEHFSTYIQDLILKDMEKYDDDEGPDDYPD